MAEPKKKNSQVLYQKNVHKTKFKYGANEDGTATGIGGRDRRNKIDEMVDQTETGRKRK
jgi:3,4-dihydroxy-2-butanone 4-phosphate synthase